MKSELSSKYIVDVDLSRYNDICKILEQILDARATALFNDLIQNFIKEALIKTEVNLTNLPYKTTGDGAILALDDAGIACNFAETLHRLSEDHNQERDLELAQKHFRVGIYHGEIFIESKKSNDGKFIEFKIAGASIASSVRLESSCLTGEILICSNTWAELPREMRKYYGNLEIISGKRESEEFQVRRKKIVEPAPWDTKIHQPDELSSVLIIDDEFNYAQAIAGALKNRSWKVLPIITLFDCAECISTENKKNLNSNRKCKREYIWEKQGLDCCPFKSNKEYLNFDLALIDLVLDKIKWKKNHKYIERFLTDTHQLLIPQKADLGGYNILNKIKKRNPDCQVVMISKLDDPRFMSKAIELGAFWYVIKEPLSNKLNHLINDAIEMGGNNIDLDKLKNILKPSLSKSEDIPTSIFFNELNLLFRKAQKERIRKQHSLLNIKQNY